MKFWKIFEKKLNVKAYYLILIVINIVCIFFILQIKFSLIPLFRSPFSLEFTQNLNDLISNISIGIIISSLFYLIVVLIPDYLKEKSTQKIIQPRINTILNELNMAIHYFHTNKIEESPKLIENLSEEDFESIKQLQKNKMNFKYEIYGTHGNWTPFSSGELTEIKFFSMQRNLVIKKIDEIFSLPTITSVDDELIELLSKLRNSQFYSVVEVYERFSNKNISAIDFGREVYDYYLIFKDLKKYGEPTKLKVVE